MPQAPEPLRVAGIVLAAGASRRMGRNKMLLELEGEALVRRAARRAHGRHRDERGQRHRPRGDRRHQEPVAVAGGERVAGRGYRRERGHAQRGPDLVAGGHQPGSEARPLVAHVGHGGHGRRREH